MTSADYSLRRVIEALKLKGMYENVVIMFASDVSRAIFNHLIFAGDYSDVIMGRIKSQITSLTIVYSTIYSDADKRKHQNSMSLVGTGEFPAQMASNAENISI